MKPCNEAQLVLTRNWGGDDHWEMQCNRTAALTKIMRNFGLVSSSSESVNVNVLCVHMCRGFVLCFVFVSHQWPDFDRLKHCEDNKELNGVVAYQLHVFRKFSSWEMLAFLAGFFLCSRHVSRKFIPAVTHVQ